ncbi:MAG TPA: hypothetical protein DD723_07130 [Candidatus Omnitrophica bacterium]|nr:MAG: hypothetical protein A2Z81_05830 [Omnitrophica WOR_2 bacterium GWA2_45_18]HBR15298.1 hypothetical protein [Candidatus Omnitrophota bacterium]
MSAARVHEKTLTGKSLMDLGRHVARQGIVVYLLLFLLFHWIVDYERLEIKTLNRATPLSFEYLTKTAEAHESFDKKKLKEFFLYFKTVTHYRPDMADAVGMLGFCYYHLGDSQKAMEAYQKAIDLNPSFFWFHYNLGVIYFQKGRYEEAIKVLRRALKTDPLKTVEFILSSRIYLPLISKDKEKWAEAVTGQIEKTYQKCYGMLVLGYYYLGKPADLINVANYAVARRFADLEMFYYYMGLSAYQLKEYEKALYFLKECVRVNPVNAEAFRYLGLSLKSLGNQEVGDKMIKKAEILHDDQGSPVSFEKKIELGMF